MSSHVSRNFYSPPTPSCKYIISMERVLWSLKVARPAGGSIEKVRRDTERRWLRAGWPPPLIKRILDFIEFSWLDLGSRCSRACNVRLGQTEAPRSFVSAKCIVRRPYRHIFLWDWQKPLILKKKNHYLPDKLALQYIFQPFSSWLTFAKIHGYLCFNYFLHPNIFSFTSLNHI